MKHLIIMPTARAPEREDPAGSPRTAREHLAKERQRLHQLVARMLRPEAADMPRPGAPPSARPAYRLLETLSALIVDEEALDERRLARMSVRVLENTLCARACSTHNPLPTVPPGVLPAGALQPAPWHLPRIGVEPLRAKGLTGKDVVVGIMDSGIDAAHPELAGVPFQFARFDKTGARVPSPPQDFGVHGTHAAGLVAGRTMGVAPGASLAIAAVLTEQAGTAGHLAQILAGLDWLVSTAFQGEQQPLGCHLINAGLQIPGYNDFLRAPLRSAATHPGVLMIAASGNDGTRHPGRLASPGNYDVTLGIGATDQQDKVAAFSQFGTVAEAGNIPKPDLCAPGVEIWSSVPGGYYTPLSGTSQASPLVCGAGALLIEQHPGLRRNVDGLRALLLDSVEPLPAQQASAGRGRLQLRAH